PAPVLRRGGATRGEGDLRELRHVRAAGGRDAGGRVLPSRREVLHVPPEAPQLPGGRSALRWHAGAGGGAAARGGGDRVAHGGEPDVAGAATQDAPPHRGVAAVELRALAGAALSLLRGGRGAVHDLAVARERLLDVLLQVH